MTEVVFASSISLLLFLVLLDTLSFCRRSAANLKWRLAADAFAYDQAWEFFNKKTSWFESEAMFASSEWKPVPEERTTAWLSGQPEPARYNLSITPIGSPVTHWQISTSVQWPLPEGGWGEMTEPYIIERHRVDRNLFRNSQ